jgi:hypothetical protein
MGKYTTKLFVFFTKNLWLTFTLNIISVTQIILKLITMILNIDLLHNINLPPLGYKDLIIFIASVLMYFMFKYLIKGVDYISSTITDNLNDSHRILMNRTRYLDVKIKHGHLPNNQFVKKLSDNGLSKEDLKEIGVNDDFINANDKILLPREILKNYLSFKEYIEKSNIPKK